MSDCDEGDRWAKCCACKARFVEPVRGEEQYELWVCDDCLARVKKLVASPANAG
jgi:hypothetical protein